MILVLLVVLVVVVVLVSRTDADKDKYAISHSGTSGSADAVGIDKDKDVGGSSSSVATDGVSGSARKQLKVSKFKVLMAVINRKKSHLPKKNCGYKTLLAPPYSFLTPPNPKSYNFNPVIWDSIVNLDWKCPDCVGHLLNIPKFCTEMDNCFSTYLFKGLQILGIVYLLNWSL